MWASIWCQRLPDACCSHTESNVDASYLKHSPCISMVLHGPYSHSSRPRSQHINRSRGVHQVDDPKPFCLWPPAMSKQIPADAKYCFPYNDKLRDHGSFSYPCLLGSCL